MNNSENNSTLKGASVFSEELVGAMIELVGRNTARLFLEKHFSKKEFVINDNGGVSIADNLGKEHFMTLFHVSMEFLQNMLGRDLAKNIFKNVFQLMMQKNLPPESVNMVLNLMPPDVSEDAKSKSYVVV